MSGESRPDFDDLRRRALEQLDTLPIEGSDKVLPLSEALRRHVRPGMLLHIGNMQARPMAALWELMRQYRGLRPEFTMVGSGLVSVFGGSALVHAQMLKKVIAAFVGTTYPTPAPSRVYNTALQSGEVEFEHWTHLTVTLRLKAAAMGVPFTTTRSLIGSSMERDNAHAFRVVEDPFSSGGRVGLLKALQPDVSVLHGLAADRYGNTLMAPPWGDNTWGAMAARDGAVVTVERIVSTDVIRRYSHLGRLPGSYVRSVSAVPFGAHPTGLNDQGVEEVHGYSEDYDFLLEARAAERDPQAMDDWCEKWLYSPKGRQGYLDRVGYERLLFLRGKAQGDSYQQEIGSLEQQIDLEREASPQENMVAVSSRLTKGILLQKGYRTLLAGAGLASLSSWIAATQIRQQGGDIDLLAEIGLYGYTPRPGDPFIFNHRNISTCKSLVDIEHILGIFASGATNSCLGSLGGGQIDKFGNINSTFVPPGQLLVGSGGANDVASSCREVVLTVPQSRARFVAQLPYTTSPGHAVSTLVSDLGVFEKLPGQQELTLTGYIERPGGVTEASIVRSIREQCGWDLKVATALRTHTAATMEELALMRTLDPLRRLL